MRRSGPFFGVTRAATQQATISEQRARTLERIAGEGVVLLVQATISFDSSHHPATRGHGAFGKPRLPGLFQAP